MLCGFRACLQPPSVPLQTCSAGRFPRVGLLEAASQCTSFPSKPDQLLGTCRPCPACRKAAEHWLGKYSVAPRCSAQTSSSGARQKPAAATDRPTAHQPCRTECNTTQQPPNMSQASAGAGQQANAPQQAGGAAVPPGAAAAGATAAAATALPPPPPAVNTRRRAVQAAVPAHIAAPAPSSRQSAQQQQQQCPTSPRLAARWQQQQAEQQAELAARAAPPSSGQGIQAQKAVRSPRARAAAAAASGPSSQPALGQQQQEELQQARPASRQRAQQQQTQQPQLVPEQRPPHEHNTRHQEREAKRKVCLCCSSCGPPRMQQGRPGRVCMGAVSASKMYCLLLSQLNLCNSASCTLHIPLHPCACRSASPLGLGRISSAPKTDTPTTRGSLPASGAAPVQAGAETSRPLLCGRWRRSWVRRAAHR